MKNGAASTLVLDISCIAKENNIRRRNSFKRKHGKLETHIESVLRNGVSEPLVAVCLDQFGFFDDILYV